MTVDPALLPAIREAIKQNEIGNGSPYVLSFARLGQSGASFGIFQGDTNASPDARDTLRSILQNAACEADSIARIMAQLSQACPNGNPLSAADAALVAAALDSTQGRASVDAMDGRLLNVVLGGLESSLAAALTANLPIEPEAQLFIALWVNMTGQPTTLNRWLVGTDVGNGVACPAPASITEENMTAYLQATKFFTENPRNFAHMSNSVNAGKALLP